MNTELLDPSTNQSLRKFGEFLSKSLVIAVIFFIFLDAFLPDFSQLREDLSVKQANISKALRTERTKIYLLGFIQNPATLYKTSELSEREGKYDNAILDMEMAIGLLELHNSDKLVIKKYYDRLNKLKTMIDKRS